jgi:hypothetical protein
MKREYVKIEMDQKFVDQCVHMIIKNLDEQCLKAHEALIVLDEASRRISEIAQIQVERIDCGEENKKFN